MTAAAPDGPRLVPLLCPTCGGPVPMQPRSPVVCAFCRGLVPIPTEHVRLHASRDGIRERRRMAETLWVKLPGPAPRWLARVSVPLLVGVVTLCVIAWVAAAMSGCVEISRATLGWWVLLPCFVALYAWLEVLAWWSPYTRLVGSMCAPRHPQVGLPVCRVCGAVLPHEPSNVAATCDYCATDSLLEVIDEDTRRALAARVKKSVRSLDEAMQNVLMMRLQRLVVRFVGIPVMAGVVALFVLL